MFQCVCWLAFDKWALRVIVVVICKWIISLDEWNIIIMNDSFGSADENQDKNKQSLYN